MTQIYEVLMIIYLCFILGTLIGLVWAFAFMVKEGTIITISSVFNKIENVIKGKSK